MSSAADGGSTSSKKRPAEENADGAEPAAQRARVEPEAAPQENSEPEAEAAAAAAPAADALDQAASILPLAPAQRCAKDTLACIFSFLSLEELVLAIAVCWDWHDASDKERSRGLSLSTSRDMIIELCNSRSPLRKHVAVLTGTMSLPILHALQELPSLTELGLWNLKEDECQIGDPSPYTVEELSEAFPPQLHSLQCVVTWLSADTVQALVDALPSMPQLGGVSLSESDAFFPSRTRFEIDRLALESLTRLPQLTQLKIGGRLSVQQLSVISQIGSLRRLMLQGGFWDSSSLSTLCHPAHRLQQLEEFDVHKTSLEAEDMQQLVRLPALTKILPHRLQHHSFPYLPRFVRLQHLVITLKDYDNPNLGVEQRETMDSALRQCAELTMVVVIDRSFGGPGAALPDATGARLVRALPHLRCLVFISICVPSLRFLQHAPQLEELELIGCQQISPVHLALLGQAAPRLTRLQLDNCADLRLDTWLLESLTPPSRLLPLLQTLDYHECRPAPEPEPEDDQPAEAESEGEGEEEEQAEADEDAEGEADEEDQGVAAMDQDGDEKEGAE